MLVKTSSNTKVFKIEVNFSLQSHVDITTVKKLDGEYSYRNCAIHVNINCMNVVKLYILFSNCLFLQFSFKFCNL